MLRKTCTIRAQLGVSHEDSGHTGGNWHFRSETCGRGGPVRLYSSHDDLKSSAVNVVVRV